MTIQSLVSRTLVTAGDGSIICWQAAIMQLSYLQVTIFIRRQPTILTFLPWTARRYKMRHHFIIIILFSLKHRFTLSHTLHRLRSGAGTASMAENWGHFHFVEQRDWQTHCLLSSASAICLPFPHGSLIKVEETALHNGGTALGIKPGTLGPKSEMQRMSYGCRSHGAL